MVIGFADYFLYLFYYAACRFPQHVDLDLFRRVFDGLIVAHHFRHSFVYFLQVG